MLGLIIFVFGLMSVMSIESELEVQSGSGFIQILPKKNATIIKCQLQPRSNGTSYNLSSPDNIDYITENFEVIKPFPGQDCGAIVLNVSALSEGTWKLTAIDDNLIRYTEETEIKILDKVPNYQTIELDGIPGESVTIECGKEEKVETGRIPHESDDYDDRSFYYSHGYYRKITTYTYEYEYIRNYCEIQNIQTEKKLRKCTAVSTYPEAGQTKEFLCRTVSPGTMNIIEKIIQVKGKTFKSNGVLLKDDKSIILSCDTKEINSIYCVATHLKTNTQISLGNNLAVHRYSSSKTDLANGICQLEFPLPVLGNETGVWKISTWSRDHSNNSFEEAIQAGCFFQVDSDSNDEIDLLKSLVSTPRIIKTLDVKITIKCEEAPYALKYCYLRTPSGKFIFPDSSLFVATSSLGLCIFKDINTEDGIYSCGFNAANENEADIIQDINVKRFDHLDVVVAENPVTVYINKSFTLSCDVVTDDPIRSCMFISPSNKIYNLPHSHFTSPEYNYFGHGLDYGDCGIEVHHKSTIDSYLGKWTCRVDIRDGLRDPFISKIDVVKSSE